MLKTGSSIVKLVVVHLLCLILSGTSIQGIQRMAEKSPELSKVMNILEDEIERHSKKIQTLRELQRKLEMEVLMQYPSETSKDCLFSRKVLSLSRVNDPVQAFVVMNRVGKVLVDIREYFDWENMDKHGWPDLDFRELQDAGAVPTEEFFSEFNEKIAKLLIVYDISPSTMKNYNESDKFGRSKPVVLDYLDLYKMGDVFYGMEKYDRALDYFCASMQDAYEKIATHEYVPHEDDLEEYLIDILDRSAFAAYNLERYEDAYNLTELLLQFKPDDQRLQDNFAFYEDELKVEKKPRAAKSVQNKGVRQILKAYKETFQACTRHYESAPKESKQNQEVDEEAPKYTDKPQDPETYQIEDDEFVKKLCRESDNLPKPDRQLVCLTVPAKISDNSGMPEMNVEMVSMDPLIVRVYDLVTYTEAKHLQLQADPKLFRATVQVKEGTKVSRFRRARTAWLSELQDNYIYQINKRLERVFKLRFEGSEDMQVVNYDLGDYYGPHLDVAGKGQAAAGENETVAAGRMATFLIYLNDVKGGGATVFPRLNLAVKPIARSALIWFNLKTNGFPDERTLHAACPVLMGTKWVATKWPKDGPNAFTRPCGLKET